MPAPYLAGSRLTELWATPKCFPYDIWWAMLAQRWLDKLSLKGRNEAEGAAEIKSDPVPPAPMGHCGAGGGILISLPGPHGLHGGPCGLGVSQLDSISGMRHVGWGRLASFMPADQCMEKNSIFLLRRNSAGMITQFFWLWTFPGRFTLTCWWGLARWVWKMRMKNCCP